MAQFAAAMLEANEDDIVFENGTIGVKGAPASAKPFAAVAGYAYVPVPLPPGLEPGLSDEAFFEPANNTYPFGCHISMLEIDRETGEPKLLKMVAVDDAGNLINPLIVEGQIHGGLAQGIGQAMIEEAVYNDDGQLMTGSFMDYAMPRATDFPRFELSATVTPTPCNPLGAKGVGEAGTLGSTPCIVSAAVDALSPFGVKHIDMMLRPEKLWRSFIASSAPWPREAAHDSRLLSTTNARRSVDDAMAKLAAGGGKLIAGGHSLVPLMKLRLSEPGRLDRHLADSRACPASARAGGRIEIGATTMHHDIATSKLLRDKCPMIAEAAAEIGDRRCRNRGTIGGSIAHADPAADMPAVMLALDAEIAASRQERRAHGEGVGLLPGLLHRRSRAGGDHHRACSSRRSRSAAYAKLHQRASHYAIVGVAAALEVKGGVIQSARIGLTGATTHAMRLTDVEKALAGTEGECRRDRGRVGAGRQRPSPTSTPICTRSADYRRAMIPVFTQARAGKGAVARLGS